MARLSNRTAAGLTALLALILGLWWSLPPPRPPNVPGKNRTVLFFTTEAHGLCNVHLSTAYALIEKHPDLTVHYASFPSLQKRVVRTSDLALKSRSPSSQPAASTASDSSSGGGVIFHPLAGSTYTESAVFAGELTNLIHPPGLKGAPGFCYTLGYAIDPWSVDDHVAQYKTALATMEEVDPSIVVLDLILNPVLEAVRDARRQHVILTPNILTGGIPAVQPPHTMLWKYPTMGSGFPNPLPFSKIPTNIYLLYNMVTCILSSARTSRSELVERGVPNPIHIFQLYDKAVPWITQTLEGAHVEVDVIPDNLFRVGPINLAGVEDEDGEEKRELVAWVGRRRTMLVNMGSLFEYSEHSARIMAKAAKMVLEELGDVQILWKVKAAEGVNVEAIVKGVFGDGIQRERLRMEKWLHVEPPTLMLENSLVASVHHGGAGCFHDALGAGVAQVVLPQWADLYDHATLVEHIDVGIWACPDISPEWEVGCLSQAFLEVLGDSERGVRLRNTAKSFGQKAQTRLGRDIAAAKIANLATHNEAQS